MYVWRCNARMLHCPSKCLQEQEAIFSLQLGYIRLLDSWELPKTWKGTINPLIYCIQFTGKVKAEKAVELDAGSAESHQW